MAKKWLTWFIDGTLVRFRGFSVIPLVAVVLLAAILVFYVVLNAAFCLDLRHYSMHFVSYFGITAILD